MDPKSSLYYLKTANYSNKNPDYLPLGKQKHFIHIVNLRGQKMEGIIGNWLKSPFFVWLSTFEVMMMFLKACGEDFLESNPKSVQSFGGEERQAGGCFHCVSLKQHKQLWADPQNHWFISGVCVKQPHQTNKNTFTKFSSGTDAKKTHKKSIKSNWKPRF